MVTNIDRMLQAVGKSQVCALSIFTKSYFLDHGSTLNIKDTASLIF
jgi:hypothetical protein